MVLTTPFPDLNFFVVFLTVLDKGVGCAEGIGRHMVNTLVVFIVVIDMTVLLLRNWTIRYVVISFWSSPSIPI